MRFLIYHLRIHPIYTRELHETKKSQIIQKSIELGLRVHHEQTFSYLQAYEVD